MRHYAKACPPWEGDPDVFTKTAQAWGLSKRLQLVYAIEEIPPDTKAAVLIYYTSQNYEVEKEKEEKSSKIKSYAEAPLFDNVIWFEQKIDNACGAYAMVHAILNGCSEDDFGKWSSYCSLTLLRSSK